MLLTKDEAPGDIAAPLFGLRHAPTEPCDACVFRHVNFCGVLCRGGDERLGPKWRHRTVPARQNIYRAGEPNEGLLVICEGWAVRFIQLPNGKRQIVSVVMPGDLVSSCLLFERQLEFSIQAVTKVRYCAIPTAEVRARICSDPELFDFWIRVAANEHRDADRRLVDLGQRPAQERVAALVVHTMLRSEDRGEFQDGEFPFPLSQQQIADCTGITPVHACRVVSGLRKNGICDIRQGAVKVVDRAELLRLGVIR